MVDLPNFGQRVYVWPFPGRNVQNGDTAILDGGSFLASEGKEIVFSEYWYRRVLAGEISFTDPRPAGAASSSSKAAPADKGPSESAQEAAAARAEADALELAAKHAAQAAADAVKRADELGKGAIDSAKKHLAKLEPKKGEK